MAAKKKFIARHEIHMTLQPGKAGDRQKGIAPTPVKVQAIEPGQRVMLDPGDDEVIRWERAGVVVQAQKDDPNKAVNETRGGAAKAPAKKAPAKKDTGDGDGGAAKAPAKKDTGDGGDDGDGDDIDLV